MHYLMALYHLYQLHCHLQTFVVVTSTDPFKAHLETLVVCPGRLPF